MQPKTRRSKRNIVVHRIALSALKEYMDTQLKVKNYGGDIYLDEGFIFAKKKWRLGYPIIMKTVKKKNGSIGILWWWNN